MKIELLTKDDLAAFKQELLQDIAGIIGKGVTGKTQYLRSKDVRKKLNISAGTLVNLRIRGLLHPTKVAGVYYYPEDEIESLLRGNTTR